MVKFTLVGRGESPIPWVVLTGNFENLNKGQLHATGTQYDIVCNNNDTNKDLREKLNECMEAGNDKDEVGAGNK